MWMQRQAVNNSTFENELKYALSTLALNRERLILKELLFSILNCRQLAESDSIIIKTTTLIDVEGISDINSDTCSSRVLRNYQAIENLIKDSNNSIFFDEKNGRIYCFKYQKTHDKKNANFSLLNFRQDCFIHSFSL